MLRVADFVRIRVSKSRGSSDNVGFFCSFRETEVLFLVITRDPRDWGLLTTRPQREGREEEKKGREGGREGGREREREGERKREREKVREIRERDEILERER